VDREAVLTPEWNINGMIRYEWPVGSGRLAAMADFNYMSSHFFQLKNSPVGEQDGYVITNARLSYTSGSGSWITSAYINNLTDEDHRLMVFDLAGSPAEGGFGMYENYAGPPRWWGVSVQYVWGG
jgi:iron complex outermembrane receptor protein